MNKLRNTLLAIFVLSMLFTVTSCDDDDDSDKAGWTEANKAAQVDACVTDEEGTREQCECLYNKIAQSYTYDEFSNIAESEDISDADLVKLLGFIVDCGVSISLE